jgi:N-succinyldiaminopimelate aminotransferase
MSAVAVRTGSVNLGQGFPDTDGPEELLEAAVEAIRGGRNQYPPGPGVPELRAAVARHQKRFYDLDVDPDSEVLVTAGATEAIAATILALCEPGDEVVVFEPLYDSYAATIALAGARRRVVTLRTPDYAFDPDELRAAVTGRTRLILLNTPHNPTGKVFSAEELALVAEVAREHDLLVVTDEVYEYLTFDDAVHVPIATLPGMRERTVAISSAGKTFSVTGWKTGWVTAPPELVRAVQTVKQFLTFTSSAPYQRAVAYALREELDWVESLRAALQSKRDRLTGGIQAAGLTALRAQGTYFVQADVRPLGFGDGLEFCRALHERAGVVAIPAQAFYDSGAGDTYVRFAFCKRDEVIDDASERLRRMAG